MTKPVTITKTTPNSKRAYHRFILINLTVLLMATAIAKWTFSDLGLPMVWPAYVWNNLSGPPLKDPLLVRNEVEMKKFNLIWYYLANANRAQNLHTQQYTELPAFLNACHGFDDYIYAMHQMIYASHALDVHTLNSIYPELGDKFQKSWVRGANLMVSACITGSPEKFVRSKSASSEWDSWYAANSEGIEQAMKQAMN